MTPVEQLLSRLDKVKGKRGAWTASCPSHKDKSPSLAIRETPDGTVLLKCFAGCTASEVVNSVGMDLVDLFPPRDEEHHHKPTKPAFYATDLLRILSFEALLLAVAASDIANSKELTHADTQRIKLAGERIQEVTHYANI